MVRGLVVADDLTGGCDTGHAFAATGNRTQVLVAADHSLPDVDVVVVNTGGRTSGPAGAAGAVREAIAAVPADHHYFKIDSTLRGNVAVTVTAAIEATSATEPPLALVVPAAPTVGRTTNCGWHLVNGTLVTDVMADSAAERPPTTSFLPDLVAADDMTVHRVSIETVARGSDSIVGRFRDLSAPAIVVPDVTHDRHLESLAKAIEVVDRPIVPVGSVGLATHIAARSPFNRGEPPSRRPINRDGLLGVIGSTNPITRKAIDNLPDQEVIRLPLEPTILGKEEAVTRAVSRAGETIDQYGRAVVTSVYGSDPTGMVRSLAEQHAIEADLAAERIGATLGTVASNLIGRRSLGGMVMAGGDTAQSVLAALGTRSILLSGHAVETGIPIGQLTGGVADGVQVITKAGGFGDERTIGRCLDALEST